MVRRAFLKNSSASAAASGFKNSSASAAAPPNCLHYYAALWLEMPTPQRLHLCKHRWPELEKDDPCERRMRNVPQHRALFSLSGVASKTHVGGHGLGNATMSPFH